MNNFNFQKMIKFTFECCLQRLFQISTRSVNLIQLNELLIYRPFPKVDTVLHSMQEDKTVKSKIQSEIVNKKLKSI